MDRLSIFLTLVSGSGITGALVVAGFSMGYYSFWTVAIAAIIGFALAWPSAYFISREIKRRDPAWRGPEKPPKRGVVPKPNAPEV